MCIKLVILTLGQRDWGVYFSRLNSSPSNHQKSIGPPAKHCPFSNNQTNPSFQPRRLVPTRRCIEPCDKSFGNRQPSPLQRECYQRACRWEVPQGFSWEIYVRRDISPGIFHPEMSRSRWCRSWDVERIFQSVSSTLHMLHSLKAACAVRWSESSCQDSCPDTRLSNPSSYQAKPCTFWGSANNPSSS